MLKLTYVASAREAAIGDFKLNAGSGLNEGVDDVKYDPKAPSAEAVNRKIQEMIIAQRAVTLRKKR